ncbi:MAG: hypothetical protein IPJ88_12460 [Myxococcales bacterium]|nr:MAG: hypothetical protein IPJ88_12460 [Myxococcales bacterium]
MKRLFIVSALFLFLAACGSSAKPSAQAKAFILPTKLSAMLPSEADIVVRIDFAQLRASKLFSESPPKLKNKMMNSIEPDRESADVLLEKGQELVMGKLLSEQGNTGVAVVRASLSQEEVSALAKEIDDRAETKRLQKDLWLIAPQAEMKRMLAQLSSPSKVSPWWEKPSTHYRFEQSSAAILVRSSPQTTSMASKRLNAQGGRVLSSGAITGLVDDFEYMGLSVQLGAETLAELGVHAKEQAKLESAASYLQSLIGRYQNNLLARALGLDAILSGLNVSTETGRMLVRAKFNEGTLLEYSRTL